MARRKVVTAVSAGGVVHRQTERGIEVVLVGRSEQNIWGLPKGTPQTGESREQTALREVREETGLDVRVLQPLGHIDYWFTIKGVRYHKTVYYYLMEATGGDMSRHDPEYDLVAWFPIDEALRLMTYPNERTIVLEARQQLARRAQLSRTRGRAPGG